MRRLARHGAAAPAGAGPKGSRPAWRPCAACRQPAHPAFGGALCETCWATRAARWSWGRRGARGGRA